MTRSLPDLQRWMHSALLRPDHVKPSDAAGILTANPRLTASQSLAIYQQSYRLRIASCMREQFPALCYALGTELFDDFVAEYIRELPPESYTLYDLGRRFAQYLDDNRPDKDAPTRESWIDFVVDLARFERSVFVTFDGPGAEDLQTATRETADIDLRPNPSLTVDRYRFPVAQYYLAVRAKDAVSPPHPEDHWVAVFRKAYQTHILPISETQHDFLAALVQVNGFDMARTKAQVPWDTAPKLRQMWIGAGLFVDARTSAPL